MPLAISHTGCDLPRPAPWRRVALFVAMAMAHAGLLGASLSLASRPERPAFLPALSVRMVAEAPPAPEPLPVASPPPDPVAEPPPAPEPLPVVVPPPAPVVKPSPAPRKKALPVKQAASPRPVAPEAAPVAASPAPPAPVVAARFDAAYLQNPEPVYPLVSRKLNEEGRVVLRVRVDDRGQPVAVEISQSSGHSRLDGAALAAVRQWRFIPARQGDAAVASIVLVPLHFTLNS